MIFVFPGGIAETSSCEIFGLEMSEFLYYCFGYMQLFGKKYFYIVIS